MNTTTPSDKAQVSASHGRHRVVVIGAGMGGLSSAIRLAATGCAVTMVDALARPGGKLGESQVDGVSFDTGPSVLTLPHVLQGVLADGGVELEDALTLHRPEPATRYAFSDGVVIDVRDEMVDTIEEVRKVLGQRAAIDLNAFLRYAKGIWDNAAPTFVFAPAPSASQLMRLGVSALGKVARIDAMRTMGAAIDARVADPHLRVILRRYATYNGSHPDRAPATLNCIAHVEMGAGLYGVKGGMARVADVLAQTATGTGVDVRLGCPARRIVVERGRVCAVELANGESLTCDAVVANADARHVKKHLLQDPSDSEKNNDVSMSGWTAVFKARRRSDAQRVGHAVALAEPYAEEFADIFDRRRPPQNPSVYVCAQEKAHHRTGWQEHEPVFVMANAPAVFGVEETSHVVELKHAVINRLQYLGWVDDDDEVVWERTPGELAATFPDTGGAIYGASSNSRLAAFKRPANRVPSVKGLYLASGSAHPGGGVPLCLQSGRLAANALIEDAGLSQRSAA